jgi:hypothetical protein
MDWVAFFRNPDYRFLSPSGEIHLIDVCRRWGDIYRSVLRLFSGIVPISAMDIALSIGSCGIFAMNTAMDIFYRWVPVATPP